MSVRDRGRHGLTFRGESKRPRRWLYAWLSCLVLSIPASAEIVFSPDIDVQVAGFVIGDDQIFFDGAASGFSAIPLPPETELTGYYANASSVVFAVDVTSVIEGTTVEPRDVARWDGTNVTLALDGSAEGIPNGARVDAVISLPIPGIFISLDTSANFGGLDVDDEDLFRISPPLMLFDGSASGIDPGLDLNGATLLPGSIRLFTFDGAGSVNGVDFDDEDLLEFDSASGVFTLHTDASAISASLSAADVNAIPEPGFGAALGVACAGMSALGRRKRLRRKNRERSIRPPWAGASSGPRATGADWPL